jgi:hypothetical protein
MLVDACCHKFPKKGLWIAVILLASFVFSLVRGNGNFTFRFNLGVFLNYTSLLRYSTGEMVAQISIPLGALVYLSRRKNLLAPPTAPVPVILEEAPAQETAPYEATEVSVQDPMPPEE